MQETFEIRKYTGLTGDGVSDPKQDPEHLHLPGLNSIASLLTYGLHEGFVVVLPAFLEQIVASEDTHLLVTRDLANKCLDGGGYIEACACLQLMRSLRWTSMRVTEYARTGRTTSREGINASLLGRMISLAKLRQADTLIMEVETLPDDTISAMKQLGFFEDDYGRWCLVFNRVPGVPNEKARRKRAGLSMGDLERLEDTLLT